MQPIGIGTCIDELYNDCISCDADDHGDKQEQNVEACTNGKEKLKAFFAWAGKCSLEIYMTHGLLLNIFKSSVLIQFSSIQGYLLTAWNFVLTVGLCALVIELLNQNKLLKNVLGIR